jgi:hypothetical protein
MDLAMSFNTFSFEEDGFGYNSWGQNGGFQDKDVEIRIH